VGRGHAPLLATFRAPAGEEDGDEGEQLEQDHADQRAGVEQQQDAALQRDRPESGQLRGGAGVSQSTPRGSDGGSAW
jgi:hypothetical protein